MDFEEEIETDFNPVDYLSEIAEKQVEKQFQEEHEKNVYSPDHFFDWERVTDKDCYTKINYILYDQTHLATQELSKVFMNKYKKILLAMQELKTIRRMYELTEVPNGWKIKITETFFQKKSNEINETSKYVYFSSITKQTFSEEEWNNECAIYDSEYFLATLFQKDFKSNIYDSNKEICINTYQKIKEAKKYIEYLENKLKTENTKDYDFEDLINQKHNNSFEDIPI